MGGVVEVWEGVEEGEGELAGAVLELRDGGVGGDEGGAHAVPWAEVEGAAEGEADRARGGDDGDASAASCAVEGGLRALFDAGAEARVALDAVVVEDPGDPALKYGLKVGLRRRAGRWGGRRRRRRRALSSALSSGS